MRADFILGPGGAQPVIPAVFESDHNTARKSKPGNIAATGSAPTQEKPSMGPGGASISISGVNRVVKFFCEVKTKCL